DHAMHAQVYRWILGREEAELWFFKFDARPLPMLPGLAEYYQSLERHHAGLYQKYDEVARHPWRLVSPDPPEPEMPPWPTIMGREYEDMLKERAKLEYAFARSSCL